MIDKLENDKCITWTNKKGRRRANADEGGKKEGSKKSKTILDHLIPRPRRRRPGSEGAIGTTYKRRREEKARIEVERELLG